MEPDALIIQAQNKILYTFQNVIKTQYKKYMPNSLVKFRQNFCHTPDVCDVIEEEVFVNMV